MRKQVELSGAGIPIALMPAKTRELLIIGRSLAFDLAILGIRSTCPSTIAHRSTVFFLVAD